MLGLGLTLGFGLLIMALSYALDPVMTCLQKRRGVTEYERLEWTTNSMFNLQRLAYEGAGQGGRWSHADGDIPVTEKGEVLAGLDIGDKRYPRIGRVKVGDEGGSKSGEVVNVVDVVDVEKNMTRGMTWTSKGSTIGRTESNPENGV